MQTMGIEEGEEVHDKDICNIVNKIKAGNFPNLEKEMLDADSHTGSLQDTKHT
jgi:hypothetical protein